MTDFQNLSGRFLVAESLLEDPNFFHTVVLLVNHGTEGAFGLVLNRGLTRNLGDILPEFQGSPWATAPVYSGGPVEQEYLFLLQQRAPQGLDILEIPLLKETIFRPFTLETKEEFLMAPQASENTPTRFFLGYAGWSPGQLEREIEQGAWLVLEEDASRIFCDKPLDAWTDILEDLGGLYSILARTGVKPCLN